VQCAVCMTPRDLKRTFVQYCDVRKILRDLKRPAWCLMLAGLQHIYCKEAPVWYEVCMTPANPKRSLSHRPFNGNVVITIDPWTYEFRRTQACHLSFPVGSTWDTGTPPPRPQAHFKERHMIYHAHLLIFVQHKPFITVSCVILKRSLNKIA
jgi:hypothetical protein